MYSIVLLFVYVSNIFSHVCFRELEIFIRDAQGTKNDAEYWHRKMESIYGAGFWNVCHGPNMAILTKTI